MNLGELVATAIWNIFRKYFARFGGLGPKPTSILIYEPTAINQKPIITSLRLFVLLIVYTVAIKNSKHHLLIINN